jgi:hypothetical protein
MYNGSIPTVNEVDSCILRFKFSSTLLSSESGILYEGGGRGHGLVIYIYEGVLYAQAGEGENPGGNVELSFSNDRKLNLTKNNGEILSYQPTEENFTTVLKSKYNTTSDNHIIDASISGSQLTLELLRHGDAGSITYNPAVNLTGSGSTSVSGTYPNFTISSTDTNTEYSAGSGLSLSGTTFSNSAPDKVVSITASGASSVSGTYPNFMVSSTNTEYTAGSGLSLSGTMFVNTKTSDNNLTTALKTNYDTAYLWGDHSVAGYSKSSDVYTKTETDTKLGVKANSSNVYTKSETDTKINLKANQSDLNTLSSNVSNKANSSDVFDKDTLNTYISRLNSLKKPNNENYPFVEVIQNNHILKLVKQDGYLYTYNPLSFRYDNVQIDDKFNLKANKSEFDTLSQNYIIDATTSETQLSLELKRHGDLGAVIYDPVPSISQRLPFAWGKFDPSPLDGNHNRKVYNCFFAGKVQNGLFKIEFVTARPDDEYLIQITCHSTIQNRRVVGNVFAQTNEWFNVEVISTISSSLDSGFARTNDVMFHVLCFDL